MAAALGLPYAFASHFAPAALDAAIAAYRSEFRPSEQLERPYVIAGVNVIAAGTTSAAQEQLQGIRRVRAVSLYARAPTIEGRLRSVTLLGEAMLNVSTA